MFDWKLFGITDELCLKALAEAEKDNITDDVCFKCLGCSSGKVIPTLLSVFEVKYVATHCLIANCPYCAGELSYI